MIAPLLEALREKDPATWEKISRGIPLQPCGQYMIFSGGEIRTARYHEVYIPFGELLPEAACAWLQAVLQEAIRGRGWAYRIEHAYRPYALIDRLNCTDSIGHHDDSPAEALLRCYLEAIG